jgi:hypothetical protein
MPIAANAPDVLEREFLELRAELLQAAARLDRLDRASGSATSDPRVLSIKKAIAILASEEQGRAEKIQLVFSRTYDAKWKTLFEMNER